MANCDAYIISADVIILILYYIIILLYLHKLMLASVGSWSYISYSAWYPRHGITVIYAGKYH